MEQAPERLDSSRNIKPSENKEWNDESKSCHKAAFLLPDH